METNFFFICICTETVKTSEGENIDHSDGSIKVRFGHQVEVQRGGSLCKGWRFVLEWHHLLFFHLFKLTPIISDPEYLLDQHILICVKSTDSDESYGSKCTCVFHAVVSSWPVLMVHWWFTPKGEGCIALKAAQLCYTEFHITLTHQGERTGTLTGGIQLRTSEGKPTEKLYGESGSHFWICSIC